jgi:hypothetical protein
MFTIFGGVRYIFGEKLSVFLKFQCYDPTRAQTSVSLSKKRQFFG